MEINEKNILEQTKGEIHQEDSEHFENREESSQQIHKDDTHQIKLLSDKVDSLARDQKDQGRKLDRHCNQNETHDEKYDKKIDSIINEQKKTAWLADKDIKDTMTSIVKDKQFQNEAVQRAVKFGGILLKIVLIIGAILTAIWTTLKLMGKNV